MEWSRNSLGNGICDLECMTRECNYDTSPELFEDYNLNENFEQYSDCKSTWLTAWPSGWAGDV